MSELPILCICTRCGREFVSLPKAWPAYDAYPPARVRRFPGDETAMVCAGKLEVTEAGQVALTSGIGTS